MAGAPVTAEIARRDAERLADLKEHWGSAYMIWRTHDAGWRAAYRADVQSGLSADTAEDLRLLIRADYDRRTLPPSRGEGIR
jgi:hypothetical protein